MARQHAEAQTDELRLTAIHEAGHAVAFVRLRPALPRSSYVGGSVTVVPDDNALGRFRHPDLSVDRCWPEDEDEAAYYHALYEDDYVDERIHCSGYAALVVAGYPEVVAVQGCEADFGRVGTLDRAKQRAVALLERPENRRAVELVAAELLRWGTLDHQRVEELVRQADDENTSCLPGGHHYMMW